MQFHSVDVKKKMKRGEIERINVGWNLATWEQTLHILSPSSVVANNPDSRANAVNNFVKLYEILPL